MRSSPRREQVLSFLLVTVYALVVAASPIDLAAAQERHGDGPSTRDQQGLVVVDLSDDFRPDILADEPALGALGRQPYGETYEALANERWGEGPQWERAQRDRYFELYGIFPSIGALRRRLLDDERHACHAAIDDGPLRTVAEPLRLARDAIQAREQRDRVDEWQRILERESAPGTPSAADRRAANRRAWAQSQLRRLGPRVAAVRCLQAHLRCDGLLPESRLEGVFDAPTLEALRAFQRRSMIVAGGALDGETREALLLGSRELDFRALLRALRERVVDATGLIEDGSASAQAGQVVGRVLDSSAFLALQRRGPLPNAAPDLISLATDAAARALGWTSPESATTFFRERAADVTTDLTVALPLPEPPAYHSASMELRAVIDPGDV